MKFLSLIFVVFTLCASAQKGPDRILKLSGGKVFFGTGDIPGFGLSVEGSKSILNNRTLVAKLFIGVEVAFETGANKPKIINPTVEEFRRITFHQATFTSIGPKISYYPARKIIPGLNISLSIPLAYTQQTYEFQADLVNFGNGGTVRRSYLEYNNKLLIGYRITPAYEFRFARKYFFGAYAGFTNYNNGDINTTIGGRFGFNL